jgi:hypothetical protein
MRSSLIGEFPILRKLSVTSVVLSFSVVPQPAPPFNFGVRVERILRRAGFIHGDGGFSLREGLADGDVGNHCAAQLPADQDAGGCRDGGNIVTSRVAEAVFRAKQAETRVFGSSEAISGPATRVAGGK